MENSGSSCVASNDALVVVTQRAAKFPRFMRVQLENIGLRKYSLRLITYEALVALS